MNKVYQKIIAENPENFEAKRLLGFLQHQQGRNDAALQLLGAALKQNPESAATLSNLGLVLAALGRLKEAVASFDKALAIRPDHAETHNNRGIVLMRLKRPGEALESFDKALAVKPDYAAALNNRGTALRDLKRPEEAVASYDKALAINPDFAETLNNRGNALRDLLRLEEAVASFDRALAIRPDYADAHNNRGGALRELKRPEEAVKSFDKALAIRPDYAEAMFDRGLSALQMGDFPAGWMDYEKRWQRDEAPARKLKAPYPDWRGEDIAGKRIIVYEEQGLGDVIQFSRYLKQLCGLGAQVTFLVRPSMHRLLGHLGPAIHLVDKHPDGETFDCQCALLSLPLAFRTTLPSIPAPVPYLAADAERRARWQQRIGSHGLKIGICWQGKPTGRIDIGRSIPLRCFRVLADIPGVRLISLQKENGLDQLAELGSSIRVETLGADFDSGPDAFLDTAAVMAGLDLIVTSDTSIAHLAGALGRPVWVALKWAPDWRWLLDRADSPWYPTMVLYRQVVRDDWDEVFGRIAADLARLAAGRKQTSAAQLAIPGAVGELFDKITILEIKAARISDPDKHRNVTHELKLLQALEAEFGPPSAELNGLVAALKGVNEALWDIEDAIRDCENRQDFGLEFIELARSVYKTNDRRAALKKEINVLFGSKIIEEKSYRHYGQHAE